MAYKFQLGAARLSGSLVQEGAVTAESSAISGSSVTLPNGGLSLNGTAVSSTAAELNLIDGSSAGTIVNSKAVIYGSSGEVNATTLQIGGTSINATAAEINAIADASARTAAAVDVSADHFIFADGGATGEAKVESLADLATAQAGNGLEASSGVFALKRDAGNNGATSFALSSDGISLSSSVAGAGLNLESGALVLNIDGLTAITSGLEQEADFILVSDGGTEKKMTFSNFEDEIFGNVSGDATIAAGGALTIASNAVEGSMLNSNVAGTGLVYAGNNLDVEASQTVITDILNTSLVIGTAADQEYIDFSTANQIHFVVNDTPVARAVAGTFIVEGNLHVSGTTTSVDSTTINISSSFTFEGPVDDHETILSCATPGADTTLNLPTLSAGTYFIPALADAATDDSAAVTAAEFALLDGGTARGTTEVVDGDGFLHNDGGTMRMTNVSKIADLFAGSGLVAVSGVMAVANATNGGLTINANDMQLNLNDLSAAEVAVANDSIAIIDANDSNATRKESIADLVSAMAGAGITATNGVLSTAGAAVAIIAAGGTLASGVNYFEDMGSDGEDAVTLPTSPSVGDSVKVKAPSDCSGARYITINRAGSQTIDGEESIRLESPFAAVELVYVASNLWRVF